MGYIRHHAIVVTSSTEEQTQQAHIKATEIFTDGKQVSNIVAGVVNGYYSFFVGPDGSKEGWEDSHHGDYNRMKLITWLKNQAYEDRSSSYSWVEFYYGDDENQVAIEDDGGKIIRQKGYKG